MCVLAGEDAEDRGWVYFTEARQFPVKDLPHHRRPLDVLQRRQVRLLGAAQDLGRTEEAGTKFFKQIDWVQGENNAYRKWPEEFIWKKEAARGHMPLTNALRGTQLEALLEHPAFAPAKPKDAATQVSDAMEGAKKGLEGAFKGLKGLKKPDWMK